MYLFAHFDLFARGLMEHLSLVLSTLMISILLAVVITALLVRFRSAQKIVERILGAVYSIPSMALFALLIPLTGLGSTTAVIVLVAYNQYILVRNLLAGIDGVDRQIIEAGTGMGMSRWQLYRKVILPLALPVIISGIRLACISTIGIATIAATINAGGLGEVLFSGMRTMNTDKILWGTLLCVVLSVVFDYGLKLLEKNLDWRRRKKYEL